jgi:PII-like signaling protein
MAHDALRVSVYVNEGDDWFNTPLYIAVLRMLHERGIAGATVLQAVAGFTGDGTLQTAPVVEAGRKPPCVIEFVDTAAKVNGIMPQLRQMANNRLIVTQPVEVV